MREIENPLVEYSYLSSMSVGAEEYLEEVSICGKCGGKLTRVDDTEYGGICESCYTEEDEC